MAEDVSVRFFSRAVDALDDIHGGRCVDQEDLNRLIRSLGEAEDVYRNCLPAESTEIEGDEDGNE